MPRGTSEDRDALIRSYREMRRDLQSAIDGLDEERLIVSSLDGWSVKDHLVHLAYWDDLRAEEVDRISAGHQSAWRIERGGQDEVLGSIVHELRRSLSLDQVRWELDRSAERLLEALSRATPAGLDPTRYGEAGLVSRHEAQHTKWIRRWRAEQGL